MVGTAEINDDPRLAELLPDLFGEISQSPDVRHRPKLLGQLPSLTVARWSCDPSCDAMYLRVEGVGELEVVEENVIGVRHGCTIALKECRGMIAIDVDECGRAAGLEIIGRSDVYEILSKTTIPIEEPS